MAELQPLATPSTSRDSPLTPHPPAGLLPGDPLAGPPSAQVRGHRLPGLPQCERQRDHPREGGPCGGWGTLQGPAPIPAGLAGSGEACGHSPQVPARRAGGPPTAAREEGPSPHDRTELRPLGCRVLQGGPPSLAANTPLGRGASQSQLSGEAPAGQAQVTGPSWLLTVGHREGGPERSRAAWVGGTRSPGFCKQHLGKFLPPSLVWGDPRRA